MAIGLKVTATGPTAKLFTGWGWSWGSKLPPHPVNNFGKPIRSVEPALTADDPVQTRANMILGVVALVAVFAGPGLLIGGLTGWSPFGMFDWLHDWIKSRSEDRHQRACLPASSLRFLRCR